MCIRDRTYGTTRNIVCDVLREHGYAARKYFYPITNSFECFHGKYDVEKTPNALRISKRVLTLPLYDDLELEHVEKICQIIKELQEHK